MKKSMLRTRIESLANWFVRVVTQPRDELTRWQLATRFGYDLGRYGARQLRQDKAPQMAGALAFRTLFGLLPVLVVGTVLMRAFRGFDELKVKLAVMFRDYGLDDLQVQGENDPGRTLSAWLLDLVEQAQDFNVAAVGWVGVAVLAYSAIGLMFTIENTFNTVYRAPEGRSWARRVPIYWTVLTLSPLAIALTVYMNTTFSAWIENVGAWQWVLRVGPAVWGFVVLWLTLLTLYKLVPNTNVSLRPALIGAFVAAILVELGRRSLGAYLGNLLSIRQLYGSLGLIPLFMFWVYLMWLVVLFGLEVAATLQMLGGRRLEQIEAQRSPTGLVDPASVLLVTELIAARFAEGRPATVRRLAELTDLPEATVRRMVDALTESGFVHRLQSPAGGVALARPASQISAQQLLELGYGLVDRGAGGHRSELVQRLRSAQRSLAAEVTLAGPA